MATIMFVYACCGDIMTSSIIVCFELASKIKFLYKIWVVHFEWAWFVKAAFEPMYFIVFVELMLEV